jgi:DNA-directed RNA polymerase specialized sigma24 family protein
MLRDAVGVTWEADPSEAELERFWAESGGHLLRAAVLLTGSREAGEDLVQAALERVLPRARHAPAPAQLWRAQAERWPTCGRREPRAVR